jgi:hypothetical protein
VEPSLQLFPDVSLLAAGEHLGGTPGVTFAPRLCPPARTTRGVPLGGGARKTSP